MRLANVIIAGATKCGTSSLFYYLGQHADICPSNIKETNFFRPLCFGDAVLPPLEEYATYFAGCTDEPYRLESSPAYWYGGARVADALQAMLDQPRVVLSLRDPVDRLWSSYQMQQRKHRLPAGSTFEDYVDTCERLLARDEDLLDRHGHHRSLRTGRYGDYLGDWLDAFGDSLAVVFFDDLVRDPGAVVSRLCAWLGIDPEPVAHFDFGVPNRARRRRSRQLESLAKVIRARVPRAGRAATIESALRRAYLAVNTQPVSERMRPQTRRRLERFYRESNATAAALLTEHGRTALPPWLATASSAAG